MDQLPENSLCTYDVTLVTSYLIGLKHRKHKKISHKPSVQEKTTHLGGFVYISIKIISEDVYNISHSSLFFDICDVNFACYRHETQCLL